MVHLERIINVWSADQRMQAGSYSFDGDMINEESKNLQNSNHSCEETKRRLTPVYYALGNHEMGYLDRKTSDLYGELKKDGAVVWRKL